MPTIVVTAEAVAGSTNTDAAEPSTPAPSTELGEKMEMAKSVITSVFESVFGGTSTLDVTGEQLVADRKKDHPYVQPRELLAFLEFK